MHLIFCLSHILTEFGPLFNRQNFALFCTFILGLITHRRQATLTEIYQAVRPKSGYGSLVNGTPMLRLIQPECLAGVYVYDETQASHQTIWTPLF